MATDRTRHSHDPAGFERIAGPPRRRVVLVEVEWSGIKDWHVMDAGPSNSIHLFIYLLGLSCVSASALRNGKLTECRLGLAS